MTAAPNRYRLALRSRDLRTLVLAFLVDQSASWSYTVALIAYVYARTGSTTWVAAIAASRWITGMLVAGYAGVLADRYDRGRLLVRSALASAAVTAALVAVVATDGPLLLLVTVNVALTAVAAPTRPASGALVPEVVDEQDLTAANAIFSFLESLIVVIGPAVGAVLLLLADPVWAVLLNAISYVVSAGLYARLLVRSRGGAEPGGNAWSQWAGGITTLARHRKALVLTLFLTLDSAAIGGAGILNAPLAAHLGAGGYGYSVLIAANAVGGVVAAGLANRLAASGRLAPVIIGSIALECVPFYLCVFAHWISVAALLQIASGVGMVVVDVLAFTALQRDLPRDVLGRVLSSVDALILGGTVLASVLATALDSAFGLAWALGIIGIGAPLIALLGLPALRAVDRAGAAEVARLGPRVELLESLDMFTGAPRAVLERLAAAASERLVAAGTPIIRQGEPSDALWILVEGLLAVEISGDSGRTITRPPVAAPGYVGELGLLHDAPRSATVTTEVEARLLRIPAEEFAAALQVAPASTSLMNLAGERLRVGSGATPTAVPA